MPRNEDNTRLKPTSVKELRDVAQRLKDAGRELTALADAMERNQAKSIQVDGMKMVERGMKYISNYIGKCRAKVGF